MNWLVSHLMKESRNRRFRPNDKVRYFTDSRKGTGKGIVLTPTFNKGVVQDYSSESRRYQIRNSNDEIVDVHPRNLIPDGIFSRPAQPAELVSLPTSPLPDLGEAVAEPFQR